MRSGYKISLHQLVLSLSHALDLVNPAMANHHERVAYTTLRVAEALGLSGRDKEEVVIAAALHDIGALSNREREEAVRFDSGIRHARFGYQLLLKFEPFRRPAEVVRFHHTPWEAGGGHRVDGEPVPAGAHIVHLADRVDSLLDLDAPILPQVPRICDAIRQLRGPVLVPEHVDAFLGLAGAHAFWLDLASPGIHDRLAERAPFSTVEMDLDGLLDFAGLMAQVIDFRSRHTATHSSGVAGVAAAVADLFGLAEDDCKRLQVAGYLHDIGKLAIPIEVLDKPGALSPEEWFVINTHPYHSHRILSAIDGLEDIANWCGMHHERLTADGYPFRARHNGIPLEARILAVADVFTALTEDRPYRSGMDRAAALEVLEELVQKGALDTRLVRLLGEHYETVDRCRIAAQAEAVREYREFMERLTHLDLSGARGAHRQWPVRMRAFLDGETVLSSGEVVSHQRCALGRWFYGEGRYHYGDIPEMALLEHPHRELHRLMAELVRLHEQGRRAEAEACYALVERLSDRIVDLLETIERKANGVLEADLAGSIPA